MKKNWNHWMRFSSKLLSKKCIFLFVQELLYNFPTFPYLPCSFLMVQDKTFNSFRSLDLFIFELLTMKIFFRYNSSRSLHIEWFRIIAKVILLITPLILIAWINRIDLHWSTIIIIMIFLISEQCLISIAYFIEMRIVLTTADTDQLFCYCAQILISWNLHLIHWTVIIII